MRKPKKYDFQKTEKRWLAVWQKEGVYEPKIKGASKRKKFYNLMMFPYPSAEGLHVGNMYAFTGSDVYGRFKRMQGFDVFEPIGLDGFGIHSENYALKVGTHPMRQAALSEKRFYKQLQKIGNGFAWKERLETYDPDYYRWTQWIFIQMWKAGLAYRKRQAVNWCPSCKTVLADEQVIAGKCERCSSVVEKRELEQWFFNIVKYADKLLRNLSGLDWTEKVKIAQRNWIGRSDGAEIDFIAALGEVQDFSEAKESFKFRDYLIPEITSGAKFVTFRMEPKKVSEGSMVQIINWNTKELVGYARITKVEEKKLGDIPLDFAGHEKDPSLEERRRKYSAYYNRPIKDSDPVWIYHFAPEAYSVRVFTTRPDTIFGATYLVLAPEHPLIKGLLANAANREAVEEYVYAASNRSEEERIAEDREKTGVELEGVLALNPATGKKVPVWIADYVLSGYGTGAIMAVPAHDERDHEFAKKFHLPIVEVVRPETSGGTGIWTEEGILTNSGKFDGMTTGEARHEFARKFGVPKTQYRLRDWLISRQRYWGAPIPMIFCVTCAEAGKGERKDMPGWYAEKEKNLPVVLPMVKDFRPKGTGESPLAAVKSFYETRCPACRSKARRETDVSDTFLDSAWYYLRYPSVRDKKRVFDPAVIKKWFPVDLYTGGAEHSVLHLLYVRFMAMVLKDLKHVHFEEPFPKFRAHGLLIKEGAKMSKSKGNVVNPDEYIRRFSADVLRMYLMFLAPWEQGGDFRDDGIMGVDRFLGGARRYFLALAGNAPKHTSETILKPLHKAIKKVTEDIESLKYNTAISQLMILFNELQAAAARGEYLSLKDAEAALKLIAPFAPFLTEDIWRTNFGNKRSIHLASWPVWDKRLVADATFSLVLQVNGKVRHTIEVPVGIKEEEAQRLALLEPRVQDALQGREPRRVIYVPGRLVNIVV